jgi:hypothetical protein
MEAFLLANTPTPQEPTQDSGLAVAIFLCCVLGLGLFFWWTNRKQRRETTRWHTHLDHVEEQLTNIAQHLARIAQALDDRKPPEPPPAAPTPS